MITFESQEEFENEVMRIVTQRLSADAEMGNRSVYWNCDVGYVDVPVVESISFYDKG